MSVEADPEAAPETRKKSMLIPLVAGLLLALAGGGGSYWALSFGPLTGLLGDPAVQADSDEETDHSAEEDTAFDLVFVPLDTVTISLGPDETSRFLILSAELEVTPDHATEVEAMAPRILDVLNSYLRVVAVDELSNPTALARLRSQMLHRIQIVTGDGRVRDLLITEFVVN